MLFNSFRFVFLFFPIVTALYFFVPHRLRWVVLLAASTYFYMAFVPKYILILVALILVDYVAGLVIEPSQGAQRRRWLVVSIVANVGILAAFKYFNFIDENLDALASVLGWRYHLHTLRWLLPLGLSFHTFQSMAYTIEVYRGNQRAERHLGIYALYVLFYPQVVAGPIERPQQLLPQLHSPVKFDYSRTLSGLQLMLWGMFKKVFVADRLAIVVDAVYDHPHTHDGWSFPYIVATYAFAFQIYCDFSGYSDIARGAARVMGFELMENFNFPYIAQGVAEFWNRWHISLSSWFRDYLYLPMVYGFRDADGAIRQKWTPLYVIVVFLVSGFWHGAGWHFGIWGASHGLFIATGGLLKRWRTRMYKRVGLDRHRELHAVLRIFIAFHLVWFTWILFRADSIADAWTIMRNVVLSPVGLRRGVAQYAVDNDVQLGFFGAALVLVIEKLQRLKSWPSLQTHRWGFGFAEVYAAILLALIAYGAPMQERAFVYFQF